jgi:protein AbiQ
MEFHRLSAAFYAQFGQYDEILNKEERPYYVLLLELDGLTYAIPLRSHISHPYCFIADNSSGQNSGLDYSKAVIIIDSIQYIDPAPVTIRQHEYNYTEKKERLSMVRIIIIFEYLSLCVVSLILRLTCTGHID